MVGWMAVKYGDEIEAMGSNYNASKWELDVIRARQTMYWMIYMQARNLTWDNQKVSVTIVSKTQHLEKRGHLDSSKSQHTKGSWTTSKLSRLFIFFAWCVPSCHPLCFDDPGLQGSPNECTGRTPTNQTLPRHQEDIKNIAGLEMGNNRWATLLSCFKSFWHRARAAMFGGVWWR